MIKPLVEGNVFVNIGKDNLAGIETSNYWDKHTRQMFAVHRLGDIKQYGYIWKETIKAIHKTVLNPEDVLINVDKQMMCKRDHPIEFSNNYYCKQCSKQHYHENCLIDFEGMDVVREQCILNNRSMDFVFKNEKGGEISGVPALRQILKRASDRKIEKVRLFDKARDADETSPLRK